MVYVLSWTIKNRISETLVYIQANLWSSFRFLHGLFLRTTHTYKNKLCECGLFCIGVSRSSVNCPVVESVFFFHFRLHLGTVVVQNSKPGIDTSCFVPEASRLMECLAGKKHKDLLWRLRIRNDAWTTVLPILFEETIHILEYCSKVALRSGICAA